MIRFAAKLAVFPLVLAVSAIELLFKGMVNLSSYAMGPLMLFIICCDIYSLVMQKWLHCLLLTAIGVGCFLVLFAAAAVIVALESARSSLTCILHQ